MLDVILTVMDRYIFRKRKSLTQQECDNIIKVFDDTQEVGVDTGQKRVDSKRNYTCVAGEFGLEVYERLLEVLDTSMREYCEKHSVLIRWAPSSGICKSFNVQKYDPGCAYSQEHFEHDDDRSKYKRLLGWMVYLNDIKKDGGTCWPQQRFTTRPRQGDLYIWPAGWTHSHYGIPAPKEVKYIVTGWGIIL